MALMARRGSLPCIPGVGRARHRCRAGEGIVSYRHPPDHDGDGYRDQSERALHPWDSAQSGQQTQLPRGGQEPQLQYPPQQSYDQQPPWNPYNQSDPGQWQGQPAWQDQAYQGQPYQGQPPYAPQQPPFTPDSRYGPPSGQPPYQHQAQYPGTPRGQLYPQALPQRYAPGSIASACMTRPTPVRGRSRIAASGSAAWCTPGPPR